MAQFVSDETHDEEDIVRDVRALLKTQERCLEIAIDALLEIDTHEAQIALRDIRSLLGEAT